MNLTVNRWVFLMTYIIMFIHHFSRAAISIKMNNLFVSVALSCPGARDSSVVEHSLMVRWVVRSILHGEPIDLFLVPASAPQLV